MIYDDIEFEKQLVELGIFQNRVMQFEEYEQGGYSLYFGQHTADGRFIRYGRGITLSSNGNVCEGYWEDNYLMRRGRCYDHDGMYSGQYFESKRHGYGK